MRYKLLGRSGLRVSELCLGTMTFGQDWGFGAPPEECASQLKAFVEAGGNFIDTANKYTEGNSERIVGDLIASERERYVVATKYTLTMRQGDVNSAGNHRKNMMQSVEASLKRLKTDYIDLYWVHAWDFTTPTEEVMRGLDDLVRQGKVLYIGVSDVPAWVVSHANTLAELRGWSRFVGLQIEYSLIERTVERDLIPMSEAFELSVAAWGPIGGGVLSGKYTRKAEGGLDSRRSQMNTNMGRLSDKKLAIAREVDAIADELGVSSTQVALAWLQKQGSNVIPIIGARTTAQLQDSLQSTGLSLSSDHLARLHNVSAIEKGFPHDFLARVKELVSSDAQSKLDRKNFTF